MQRLKFVSIMIVGILFMSIEHLFAIAPTPNVDVIINYWDAIVAALTMLSGFIIKMFHIKHDDNSTKIALAIKVFSAGLVIAGGFSYYGFTNFLPSLFIVFSTMGLYDLVRGLFNKKKKSK